jgi:hypothetical protein
MPGGINSDCTTVVRTRPFCAPKYSALVKPGLPEGLQIIEIMGK